jgi:CRP-like cAMP-binding protein
MKKELIEKHLQQSILFQDIKASDLSAFSEVCRVQIVPEGNFAYRQGDESEVFYVIAMGDAEMVLERKDGGTSIVGPDRSRRPFRGDRHPHRQTSLRQRQGPVRSGPDLL